MPKQQIALIASLIGDKARSAILVALLSGRALTAGELAREADISPQTASSHLNKLVAGGLVTVAAQGRHRYYQLSNSEVVHALEALALIAPRADKHPQKPLDDIRYARSCYDHLAGKIGVLLTQALLKQKYITLVDKDYVITSPGKKFFATFGINTTQLTNTRRRLAYPCLDWSERVHHLAGALGAALLQSIIEKRWGIRSKKSRALHLTPLGQHKLNSVFKIKT